MHKRGHTTKVLTTLAAATFVIATAACGDDDSSTATTSATPTTGATATTTKGSSGGAGAAAFCDAELAAEKAANTDVSSAGPAFEALVAAAPTDIKDDVQAVIDNAQAGPGSPEFDEPYGKMISYMKDTCGFNDVSVSGAEYKYENFPTAIKSGKTIFTFKNTGNEFHQLAIIRVKDGVTDKAEDILNLSEEEVATKADIVGVAFAAPGSTANTVADLSAGRYLFACFLPVGATPEMMQEMSGPEDMPAGTKTHWMSGMVQEVTIS